MSSLPPAEDEAGAMPPDIAALLASERRAPAPPDAVRAGVLAGVNAAVASAAAGTTTGAALGAGAGLAQGGGLLLKGLIALAVAAGVVGGGVYLVATREPESGAAARTNAPRASAPQATRAVEPPVARPAVAAPVSAPRIEPALPASPARATAPQAAAHGAAVFPARAPRHDDDAADETDPELRRENDLLEPARVALSRRDGAAALAALEQHMARFGRGRLAQERDAIWVQALVLSGDAEAARGRAERFRRAYPRSVFLGVVEAALGQAP